MLSPGQLGRGRGMQTPHPACWLVHPLLWPPAQQSSRARAGDLPVSSRGASGLAGVKQLSLPITMFPARTFHPNLFSTVWDCVAALGSLQSHDCVPFSPAKVRGKVWHAAAAQLGLLQLAVQGSTSGRAVLCVTGSLPSTSPGSKLICSSNLGDTRVTCCPLAAGTSWERDLLTGEEQDAEAASSPKLMCFGHHHPTVPQTLFTSTRGLSLSCCLYGRERAQESKFYLCSVLESTGGQQAQEITPNYSD